MLPDKLKSIQTLEKFKTEVKKWDGRNHDCHDCAVHHHDLDRFHDLDRNDGVVHDHDLDHNDGVVQHCDHDHLQDVAQEGGRWGVTTADRSLTRLSCRDMEDMW